MQITSYTRKSVGNESRIQLPVQLSITFFFAALNYYEDICFDNLWLLH